MQSIVYYVAVSIDGFICGLNEDISAFPAKGPVVDDYLERLGTYATVLMGRRTYEFGYRFGLEPGANPYPAARSFVISQTIDLPPDSDVTRIDHDVEAQIRALTRSSPGPIYLCGGGALAGWMAERGLIDRLRLKRAPIIYGDGTPLFGASVMPVKLSLRETRPYDEGVVFQDFDILN